MLYERCVARYLVMILLASSFLLTAKASADVFELRTYTTNDGKLDNLNARFRDHTVALFKKHGMESSATGCRPTNLHRRTR